MFKPLNHRINQWHGRRVWVVGASSGIGAALAQALLQAGARVVLSARSASGLAQVAAGHPLAEVLPLDVTDATAWAQAAHTLQQQGAAPDLVVFCAAVYRPQHSWELQADEVAHTLQTNLAGVYYGLQAVLPGMRTHGHGGVAIVASVAGYVGLPGAAVYGPTKAALINLAELLYSELHPQGLDVYLVNPGFVQTRLTARNRFAMPALLSPDQAAQAILQGLARGRFEIHFPRRFTLLMQLLRHLPARWRFALVHRATAESGTP